MTLAKITRTAPVARLRVIALALFANLAAILAQSSVEITQKSNVNKSGAPPITKWLTEPVKAVNAMINTLVPTAVFNSYPNTVTKINNIIMPPPAPTKPQINPIIIPQRTD